MFSSGIFIMICTILRAHYSLGDITNLPIALGWADRECFVAAIVVSLPGIKPLFRNTRWLGSSGHRKQSGSGPYYGSGGYNHFGSKASGKTRTFISSRRRGSSGRRRFEVDSVLQRTEKGRSDGGSEEYILDNVKGPASPSVGGAGVGRRLGENGDGLAIRVTTEYSLESEQGLHGRSVGVGSSGG